jgi:hypothetical protein
MGAAAPAGPCTSGQVRLKRKEERVQDCAEFAK